MKNSPHDVFASLCCCQETAGALDGWTDPNFGEGDSHWKAPITVTVQIFRMWWAACAFDQEVVHSSQNAPSPLGVQMSLLQGESHPENSEGCLLLAHS